MEEKSLFIEFMGDSPMTRIFDYLLTEQDVDFSISDTARNARVGRTTLYRIWDKLIEKKIIIPTRVIGKSKLYKLNKNNIAINKLIEVDNILVIEDLKKRSGNKKIKVAV
jgi:hypothetical protein